MEEDEAPNPDKPADITMEGYLEKLPVVCVSHLPI